MKLLIVCLFVTVACIEAKRSGQAMIDMWKDMLDERMVRYIMAQILEFSKLNFNMTKICFTGKGAGWIHYFYVNPLLLRRRHFVCLQQVLMASGGMKRDANLEQLRVLREMIDDKEEELIHG